MKIFPDTIRNRLVLLFGGLTLIVGLPTYVYVNYVYQRQLIADRSQALRDLGVSVAAELTENLSERQREISLLARTPLFRAEPFSSNELMGALERLQSSYPDYSWIGLADSDAIVRASTGRLLSGSSVAQRPWFIHGLTGEFTGDVHEALLLAKLLPQEKGAGPNRFIDFAAPVLDMRGNVRGVLAAHARWKWAGKVISLMIPRNAAQAGLEVFIINSSRQIIYPEGADNRVKLPESVLSESSFMLNEWNSSSDYVSVGVPVHEANVASPLGWRVIVRQPTAKTLADVIALKNVLLRFALAAIALFLALVWWSASLISRPVRRLAALAEKIADGDEGTVLDLPTNSLELRQLVDALQRMATRLIGNRKALAESNTLLERKVEERTAELEQANVSLQRLARYDALTGLANRLSANEHLQTEFSRMKRTHVVYAVMMLDIDFFKRVNDTYGHAIGDDVLKHIAILLETHTRETDFVARLGGEEFLVLLPATALEAALLVAEKIRAMIESSPEATAGRTTVSIGLTVATPQQLKADEAVKRADELLYEAKGAGRNRVIAGL